MQEIIAIVNQELWWIEQYGNTRLTPIMSSLKQSDKRIS